MRPGEGCPRCHIMALKVDDEDSDRVVCGYCYFTDINDEILEVLA